MSKNKEKEVVETKQPKETKKQKSEIVMIDGEEKMKVEIDGEMRTFGL